MNPLTCQAGVNAGSDHPWALMNPLQTSCSPMTPTSSTAGTTSDEGQLRTMDDANSTPKAMASE